MLTMISINKILILLWKNQVNNLQLHLFSVTLQFSSFQMISSLCLDKNINFL